MIDEILSSAKESLSGTSTHILTAFVVTSTHDYKWVTYLAMFLVLAYAIVWGYHFYKRMKSPEAKALVNKCQAALRGK